MGEERAVTGLRVRAGTQRALPCYHCRQGVMLEGRMKEKGKRDGLVVSRGLRVKEVFLKMGKN